MTSSPPIQATAAVQCLRDRMGDDLLAVWLYGSFVDGGVQPGSDIDLLALLRRRLDEQEHQALMTDLLVLSHPPGDPARRALEVTCVVQADIRPWRHPAMRELQFGEWLREELGRGQVAARQTDPDLALLITQARRHGVALHGGEAGALLPVVPGHDIQAAIRALLPEVATNLIGEEKHALLTLARMWVTLRTGAIVSKAQAAAWVAPQLPPAHRLVIERAADVYRGTVADDWTQWQQAVADCARHMKRALEEP